jgi:menaquinone-dependent protoporphyrinogen oxidase
MHDKTILVAYATSEGQTAKVADRVAATLRDQGFGTTTVGLDGVPSDVSVTDHDGVVVAASVHLGRHQPAAEAFVENNRESLAARPSAFLQVSLSAASDDPERLATAERYVEEFLAETRWEPDLTASVAGALRYSEYGFLKRLAMRQIAKEATGDVDTGRDYEYTDWDAVTAFATRFGALVADATEVRVGDASA